MNRGEICGSCNPSAALLRKLGEQKVAREVNVPCRCPAQSGTAIPLTCSLRSCNECKLAQIEDAVAPGSHENDGAEGAEVCVMCILRAGGVLRRVTSEGEAPRLKDQEREPSSARPRDAHRFGGFR